MSGQAGPNFTSPPVMGMASGNPLAQIHTDLLELTKAINRMTQQVAASFPQYVSPPATTADPGIAGQVAYDGTYFYICVANATWGRVLLDFAF